MNLLVFLVDTLRINPLCCWRYFFIHIDIPVVPLSLYVWFHIIKIFRGWLFKAINFLFWSEWICILPLVGLCTINTKFHLYIRISHDLKQLLNIFISSSVRWCSWFWHGNFDQKNSTVSYLCCILIFYIIILFYLYIFYF